MPNPEDNLSSSVNIDAQEAQAALQSHMEQNASQDADDQLSGNGGVAADVTSAGNRRSADVQFRETQRNMASASRAAAAEAQAERQRLLTSVVRTRLDVATGGNAWDADAANTRAQARAELNAQLLGEGGAPLGSAPVMSSAPVDAGEGFVDPRFAEAAHPTQGLRWDTWDGDDPAWKARGMGYKNENGPVDRGVVGISEFGGVRTPGEATGAYDRLRDAVQPTLDPIAQRFKAYAAQGFARASDATEGSPLSYVTGRAAEALGGVPTEGSGDSPRYNSYKEARARAAEIEDTLKNDYTKSGRFSDINGDGYNDELQGGLREEGLAPNRPGLGARMGQSLRQHGWLLGGGLASAGESLGRADEAEGAGQYVTPEQQREKDAGLLPGLGMVVGTVAGAALGNPMLGGFAGGAVGSVAQSAVSSGAERDQALRETSERLASALGQASESATRFRDDLAATGAPIQALGQALTTVGGMGTFGPNTISGTGALVNSFGEYTAENFAAMGRVTANPLDYQLGRRVSEGLADSGDFTSAGYQAAETGEFADLKTDQHAAVLARRKGDTRLQQDIKANNAIRQWGGGLGGFLEDHMPDSTGGRFKALIGRREAEDDAAPDPDAAAQNDTINQVVAARSAHLVDTARAQSAAAGIDISTANGGGAAAVSAASDPLYGRLHAEIARDQVQMGVLQRDAANPVNAARLPFLNEQNAEYETDALQATQQIRARRRQNFGLGLSEEQAGFGLSVTRAQIEGKSAEDIYARTQAQSRYLQGVDSDPRNPLSPSERAGIEQSRLQSVYQAQQGVYTERTELAQNAIGAASVGVDQARAFGSSDQVQAALGQEASAVAQKVAELTRELNTAGQTAADYRREQGELNSANAQAVQIAARQRDQRVQDAYGISGDRLSGDQAGLSRQIRVGGSGSVDQGALDRDWSGVLKADNDAIGQYAPGSRERADAEAKLRRDQADQADQRDRLNQYTPDAGTRIRDIQTDEGLSRAEHAFRRSQIAPFSDAGADPCARAGDLEGAISRSQRQATSDFAGATAYRARQMQSGRWNELAEEGYQGQAARYQEGEDGLADRRAELERDKLEGFFGALPEMVAGNRGLSAGVGSALVPTAALSARYSPNAGVGSWADGKAATWWSGGHPSPYGHGSSTGDGGTAAGGAMSEGNRYLAEIASGINTLVGHVQGGSHGFGPSVPNHAVSTVAGSLQFDLNPRHQ
jgi:hypothetical protein